MAYRIKNANSWGSRNPFKFHALIATLVTTGACLVSTGVFGAAHPGFVLQIGIYYGLMKGVIIRRMIASGTSKEFNKYLFRQTAGNLTGIALSATVAFAAQSNWVRNHLLWQSNTDFRDAKTQIVLRSPTALPATVKGRTIQFSSTL